MSNPWIREFRPLIIAHRGHGVAAPENTISAYRLAVEAGAEMIETDVNITKDGKLVIIHDWRLGRTTDLKGKVHEFHCMKSKKPMQVHGLIRSIKEKKYLPWKRQWILVKRIIFTCASR